MCVIEQAGTPVISFDMEKNLYSIGTYYHYNLANVVSYWINWKRVISCTVYKIGLVWGDIYLYYLNMEYVNISYIFLYINICDLFVLEPNIWIDIVYR